MKALIISHPHLVAYTASRSAYLQIQSLTRLSLNCLLSGAKDYLNWSTIRPIMSYILIEASRIPSEMFITLAKGSLNFLSKILITVINANLFLDIFV